MESQGILTKVESATHVHPAFFAKKPNGDLRLLVNAVYLNNPLIDELLYQVLAYMVFTAIQFIGGHIQCRLDPKFAKYVHMVLPWTTYRYNVMPQRLKTSVKAFQGVLQCLYLDI